MLEDIQKLNDQYLIKSVFDSSFQTYGSIVQENMDEAINFVKEHSFDASYIPSVKEVEDIPCIQKLSQKIYGYLDVIAGVVSGHNEVLNGIEYHQCSEVIIAVTDYILVVGHRWDMQNQEYDSSKCEIFYVPQGTVVECYATTLHYTPICVEDGGFQTICLLLKGTGDSAERIGILKKKNKWFIAHKDNVEKVKLGDYPGLKGKMIHIIHK